MCIVAQDLHRPSLLRRTSVMSWIVGGGHGTGATARHLMEDVGE